MLSMDAVSFCGASSFGETLRNLSVAALYEEALRRGEARVSGAGALVAETGVHTGRAPNDKFIVRDASTTDTVDWANTQPMSPAHFSTLLADMTAAAREQRLYAQDLFAGADPAHRLKVSVYTELAWHSLFIRNLLIRPDTDGSHQGGVDLTILDLPSFRANPARHGSRTPTVIAIDFSRRIVLIAGTSYAGEIKKSVFSCLNFLLPPKGVLPMHCAVNLDARDGATVFFGLSGTGKTTLSTDASRMLIGDDEHGWGESGVFTFEGGCYAKAIDLSPQHEPEIHAAAQRFGAVLENVALEAATRAPDFADRSLTENTRIAYPLDFIPNASATGRAAHPRNIVMLTCDAFGVLPPIAKLDHDQAMYHFLSGYTAKVSGTEKGVSEPQATFSTCFGAPFMPRRADEYGNLLRALCAEHDVSCWLVNTGWSGGAHGVGRRMPIALTRRLLRAALSGELAQTEFRIDPHFGLAVPSRLEGVDSAMLDPIRTWSSPQAYVAAARRLVEMFDANFTKFENDVDAKVRGAKPGMRTAA
jgi:phosphoenolpyruvate carboxykinase (ATP)